MLRNHHVLGNVYKTARQITGVSCFQCGIRETLSSTVGRYKVLIHRKAFAEVRDNRRFDDAAVRLGHQTTHASQLPNLRW